MSDVAIRVAGVGKRYKIGQRGGYRRLTEALTGALSRPFQRREKAEGDRHIWALKDVSFEVKKGEAVGIIGRNGAGKSTLLKILSRITEMTEGAADIHGRIGSLLEVGTGFHPELTGRENIFLNGAIIGMKRAEIRRKFNEIVDFSEVEKFLDTPVKHYSSGMYMRLAFAVAANLLPEVLVIDEVLAVGDAAFQAKCLGKMGEVAKAGRTVLFVSHNLGAINALCGRCILLEEGRVKSVGVAEEVTGLYLRGAATAKTSMDVARVDADASFVSFGLRNSDGPTTVFDVRRPIEVHMNFCVRKAIVGLQASVAVFNSRGARIFYHSTAYAEPPLVVENPGEYEISAEIPGRLLIPGAYSVNVALHIPNVAMFDKREHALQFEVLDAGSGRYEYKPDDMGFVLVDLKWKQLRHGPAGL